MTHWEILIQSFRFPECDADLVEGLMSTQRQVQQGVGRRDLKRTPPSLVGTSNKKGLLPLVVYICFITSVGLPIEVH